MSSRASRQAILAAHIAKPCQHGAWPVGLVSENEQRLIVGAVVLQALQDDGGELGLSVLAMPKMKSGACLPWMREGMG
ncbi:MAG: hypothetical protein ACOH13_07905 [Flavobacteriales bacterium]